MSPVRASSSGFKQSEVSTHPKTFVGKGYIPPESPAGQKLQAMQGKYKNIAPYLQLVQAAASNAHIDPNFLAGILATENGGWEKWNPRAVSPAGALGIAQFMPGTWRTWGKGGNPNNPSDAIPASARMLAQLLKEHGGNFSEAAQSYNGGSYRGADTRRYAASVRGYMEEIRADGVLAGKVGFPGIPNPLDVLDPAKDAIQAASELLQILLSPRRWGELAAKVLAYTVKFIGKAIWDYVVAPVLHWHQRAAVYYFDQIMTGKAGSGFYYSTAGIVTVSFWATGYAILWAKVDDEPSAFAARPSDTPLGRAINGTRTAKARRKLTPPSKVSEETPAKPEPVKSAANIVRVDTLSVTRGRPVNVQRGNASERRNDADSAAA